ncbi:MAG: FUSC family protein [Methanobacterium sp.]|uniref:FUSC family protein n=1 Tax=Methanobacterium sp. TaxID=2164 RepID=UPI003D64857C|nr:FUSC family protein [Methanobacterium sp.]
MQKKSFFDKFKRLSRPTGSPQWGQAIRAVILMVLAALIAKFLGFDNGIGAIMFITLLATIIIDVPLPIKKVAVLALLGLLMTILAFISASLALSSITIFICFTVIWAFFSLSMYIFGNTVGYLGFTFFTFYFLAVITVNNHSTTLDWAIYCILAYLVVFILFIPKIFIENKRVREMAVAGFIPQNSVQNILLARQILSGISIDSQNYEIFKFGSYYKGFRSYSDMIIYRLDDKSQLFFKKLLKSLDETSLKITQNFINKKGKVDLKPLDIDLSKIKENSAVADKNNSDILMDILGDMRWILHKTNELLSNKPEKTKMKIFTPQRTLRDVLEANFNLKNIYIRHAIRFTLAMTVALAVVYFTHGRDAIWVTMGVLIIIKPDITSTINNMILRVGFNFFAIILAIILAFIFPHQILIYLAFLMLFLFRAFFPNYMGLSVMALTVFVVLIWPIGTVFDNAIARIVDISVGAIIAFISAYLILPSRVRINLPEQIIKTIKSNAEYANQVLLPNNDSYNHDKAFKSFKKYMLEENNLEAAIRKIQDSFNDIDEDLAIYQEIAGVNNKLAADLTAVATTLEKDKVDINMSKIGLEIQNALNYLIKSTDEDFKPKKFHLVEISSNKDSEVHIPKTLEQYLNWIVSDIQLLYNGVEIAFQTGALQRYKKLE